MQEWRRLDARQARLMRSGRVVVVSLVAVAAVVAVVVWALTPGKPAAAKFFDVAPAIAGQYIVVLPPQTPADAVSSVAAALTKAYGGRVTHRYADDPGSLRGFALVGMSAAGARSLAKDRRVKFVEQVARAFTAGKRTNPGWALDRIDQRSNTPSGVYRYSADGEGVRVYVLDTGIDDTHPDFSSYGIHFGFDAFHGTGTPCNGHGTAMAGLIAGATTGVAPAAEVVNVKVFNCTLIGNSTATIIDGITWVTAHASPPAVANLSLQLTYGEKSQAMRVAVADLQRRDVLVVAAAGNDNNDVAQVEPANYPGVVAVGGSVAAGSRWVDPGATTPCAGAPQSECGSNFGAGISVFAPASANSAVWGGGGGGYTLTPVGTSSAAAIVSGVAAATLQAFWKPLQPGLAYTSLPSEAVRQILLQNATDGALTPDPVHPSPNRFVFAETWPVSLGRVEVSSQGGLTAVAGNPSSPGQSPSFLVSGGLRDRFDETPTLSDSPYAAQAFDQGIPRWTQPHLVSNGGCADVYDINIAHAWLACTHTTPQGPSGIVKAVSVLDGSLLYEVPVGFGAAAAAGQTCTNKHSIARAVRLDTVTNWVYAVGEAWCGTGPRTGFLAELDTQASTVVWEKRVFFDQNTKSSAAFAVAARSGIITVAGSQTLNNGTSPVARVAQFSKTGASIGTGISLATPGPSAAYAITADDANGDLYVGSTRETASGAVGVVDAVTPALGNLWEQTLDGAHLYSLAAVHEDGVIVAGGTRRFLPSVPVIPPWQALVGLSLGPTDRGFLIRFDAAGTLRWTHLVDGGPVVDVSLQGANESGDNVIAHAVGVAPQTPCSAPHCLQPPLVSYVESFRVK